MDVAGSSFRNLLWNIPTRVLQQALGEVGVLTENGNSAKCGVMNQFGFYCSCWVVSGCGGWFRLTCPRDGTARPLVQNDAFTNLFVLLGSVKGYRL